MGTYMRGGEHKRGFNGMSGAAARTLFERISKDKKYSR